MNKIERFINRSEKTNNECWLLERDGQTVLATPFCAFFPWERPRASTDARAYMALCKTGYPFPDERYWQNLDKWQAAEPAWTLTYTGLVRPLHSGDAVVCAAKRSADDALRTVLLNRRYAELAVAADGRVSLDELDGYHIDMLADGVVRIRNINGRMLAIIMPIARHGGLHAGTVEDACPHCNGTGTRSAAEMEVPA